MSETSESAPQACEKPVGYQSACKGPVALRRFKVRSGVLGGVETYVCDVWCCEGHFADRGFEPTDEPVTDFLSDEERRLFRSPYNGEAALPATRLAHGTYTWMASPGIAPCEALIDVEADRHHLRVGSRSAYGDHPFIAVGSKEAVTAAYVRHYERKLKSTLAKARRLAVLLAPYRADGGILGRIEQASKKAKRKGKDT